MSKINKITFYEDEQLDFTSLLELSQQWYKFNKDKIKILSAVHDVTRKNDYLTDFRRSINIRYTGEAGPNPQTCPHNNIDDITIDSTCQNYGSTTTQCLDCGLIISKKMIPPSGHSYNYIYNNDATCTKDGTKTGTCKWCNEKVKIPAPGTATGHEYNWVYNDDATCLRDGTETGTCKHNDDTQTRTSPETALGHDFPNEWIVENAPGCSTNGKEYHICKRCGVKEERVIPATGHNWISNNDGTHTCQNSCGLTETCSPNNPGSTCDKCGYTTPVKEDPIIITDTIPDMNVNEEFNFKIETSESGGIFDLVEGSLPAGLQLHTDGTITGTPISPGTTIIKIQVRFHDHIDLIYKEFIINIIDDVGEFVITTEFINGMTVGQEFSQMLTTNISSEDVDWDIAAGIIPTGLVFYRTGELAGTAQVAGIYEFTIKATYKEKVVTKTFTVNVASINFIVTFDSQGGICNETTRTVSQGSTIGTLPECTRDEYEFGGWFTAIEGGLKVDSTYSISSNVTLYARWGQGTDIDFGDATSQFNMQYKGDRTNYNNLPYTIYHRVANGAEGEDKLITQVGISSVDRTNNMSDINTEIKLYLKVTNDGVAGNFDIGFDCDSYVEGTDKVKLLRLENGVRLGTFFEVTIPYDHTLWIGDYSNRTKNRYNNSSVGSSVGEGTNDSIDTGYALTMNNIFINSKSYVILEVTFKML